jgi:hypothetical protein
LLQFSSFMNGLTDTGIGAAAADIARHGVVYVLIGGVRLFPEQDSSRHKLTGLAIPALRDVKLSPGQLQRMVIVQGQALDGSHLPANGAANLRHAGPHSFPVEVYRAGAALRNTTSKFGARESQEVPQYPQQRHVGVCVYLIRSAVDL